MWITKSRFYVLEVLRFCYKLLSTRNGVHFVKRSFNEINELDTKGEIECLELEQYYFGVCKGAMQSFAKSVVAYFAN